MSSAWLMDGPPAVQETLRHLRHDSGCLWVQNGTLGRQGKLQLSVSEKTLIAQVSDAGLLLDEDNQLLTKDAKRVKSKQCTLGGQRKRYVRIRIGSICPADRLVDALRD